MRNDAAGGYGNGEGTEDFRTCLHDRSVPMGTLVLDVRDV